MKTLMLTTALTAATAFGALAQSGSDPQNAQGGQTQVPAFLASDFTGMTLYTLDSEDARAVGSQNRTTGAGGDARPDAGAEQMRWTSSDRFLAERDSWTDIGDIEDIVMTMDGEIRGVLLDVGGFLGMGAFTVMVDIADLHFVSDDGAATGMDDFNVVVAMSQDELEDLPEWDGSQLEAGFEMRADRQPRDGMAADTDRTGGTAVFGDDHRMLEGEERTADRLSGADVHDANGESIGTVEDVVLGEDNRVTGILVDVGGFLGIGSHTVELPIDQARIGWSESDDSVRVQVRATADQLEDMPEHDG